MGFLMPDAPSSPGVVTQETVAAKTPAKRPERVVEVDAEDIELGSADSDEQIDTTKQGKRSLTRPTGGTVTTGAKI